MKKGFFPCSKATIKIKNKEGKEVEVPWMQCMNANDFETHAINVKIVDDARKGLVGKIDRYNGDVKQSFHPIPCPWYKRIFGCKERVSVK